MKITPTIFKILKEGLFDLHEQIKNNFIGITHDRAAVLSSDDEGLIGLLQGEFKEKNFYDLSDPCHSINLIVSKSLQALPREIMKFFNRIHKHFTYSPHRVAKLLNIQRQNFLPQLRPVFYVKTGWLSIGQTTERLILIWDALKIYMAKKFKSQNEHEKCQEMYVLLSDDVFKPKIILLSDLLKKLNKTNGTYQSQYLEIQSLKSEMLKCAKFFVELVLDPEQLKFSVENLTKQKWNSK